MFKKSFPQKDRVNKIRKPSRRSFRDDAKLKLREQLNQAQAPPSAGASPQMNRDILTIIVGKDQRLFAAHEHVLCLSPYLEEICMNRFFYDHASHKHIALADEDPEIFSSILQFLYKGDYSPRLLHDKKRNTWVIEEGDEGLSPNPEGSRLSVESKTMYTRNSEGSVLRDTVIYCAADMYGLPELKRLALRKQGLTYGADVATILRSARYAYANTDDSDSRLRAHYLALIIRSRKTFKRSGTMQKEMDMGGKMFFDLFVAMANHIDELSGHGITMSSPSLTV